MRVFESNFLRADFNREASLMLFSWASTNSMSEADMKDSFSKQLELINKYQPFAALEDLTDFHYHMDINAVRWLRQNFLPAYDKSSLKRTLFLMNSQERDCRIVEKLFSNDAHIRTKVVSDMQEAMEWLTEHSIGEEANIYAPDLSNGRKWELV